MPSPHPHRFSRLGAVALFLSIVAACAIPGAAMAGPSADDLSSSTDQVIESISTGSSDSLGDDVVSDAIDSPTVDQYLSNEPECENGCDEVTPIDEPEAVLAATPEPAAGGGGGALPFTGLTVKTVWMAGLMLLFGGTAFHVLAHRRRARNMQ